MHALARDLWRWQIDLDRVALLDTSQRLRRVGLPPARPTASQWPAYEAVGDQLHRGGYQALLVTSAARPRHHNLVVFRPSRRVAGCTLLPPPTTIADPLRPSGCSSSSMRTPRTCSAEQSHVRLADQQAHVNPTISTNAMCHQGSRNRHCSVRR